MSVRWFIRSFVCFFVCIQIPLFGLWHKRVHWLNTGFKRGNCRIWHKVENISSIWRNSPPTANKWWKYLHFIIFPGSVGNLHMWRMMECIRFTTSYYYILYNSLLYYYVAILNISKTKRFQENDLIPFSLCLFRNIIRNFISIFCFVVLYLDLLAWVKCHLGSVDFPKSGKNRS